MEASTNSPDTLRQLHLSLQRKYKFHAGKIREIWPTFDRARRAKAVKAGSARGEVLKSSKDASLGNAYKILPEWNLHDLTEPGSNYLLDLLEHRATKTLHDQYLTGLHGRGGDAQVIFESMRTQNLRHVEPFRHSFTLFLSAEQYGQSMTAKDAATYRSTMARLSEAVDAGLCVPQSTGELILTRQTYFMSFLDQAIDDILDLGSTTRDRKKRPEKDAKAAQDALAKLSIEQKPETASVGDLLAASRDYRFYFDDAIALLYNEPAALAHELKLRVFTQPEFVKDEKGRTLLAHTDKHISSVFFEMLHGAIATTARWSYISLLLELLLKSENEKNLRLALLQHLSDTCHAEFICSQKLLKRYLSGPGRSGEKYFRRVSNTYDNGVARVNQKINPNNLPPGNAQLTYFLQLCHPSTNASKAADRIKKLDDLWQSSPTERDSFDEAELDALGNLIIIISFTQSLSASLKLPPPSQAKRRLFATRAAALDAEMDLLRHQLDLSPYASPIDNLLEPGMAHEALESLSKFIVDKAGATPGSLYQDLVDTCIADIQKEYQLKRDVLKENVEPVAEASSFAALPGAAAEPDGKFVIQQRREKEKTRPAHSSFWDVAPQLESTIRVPESGPPRAFSVKRSTFAVFSTIFSKEEDQGSVSWSSFVSAMTDLQFSVVPNSGSIFTFVPPVGDEFNQRRLTVHRPHGSRLEGYKLRFFARRLSRVYGWGKASFQPCQPA